MQMLQVVKSQNGSDVHTKINQESKEMIMDLHYTSSLS
jgi:hypothetical protein